MLQCEWCGETAYLETRDGYWVCHYCAVGYDIQDSDEQE